MLRLTIFLKSCRVTSRVRKGLESGWMSILKAGQRFLAPYQLSDIHTAADIQEFGWGLDIQELGAIGAG